MLKNSHTLVICSRGRSHSLSNLIKSILDCHGSEAIKIVVVLNGHSSGEFISLAEQFSKLSDQVQVIESSPGLVAARNFALKKISTDLVSFLDDDILLPRNYLSEIDSAFTRDEKLSGLAPRIAGLYTDLDLKRKRFRNKKIDFGKVTKIGHNYWVPDIYSRDNTPVEWLPGCSMSYRVSSIAEIKFSEELMLGPAGGYSLGEDVDFSIRVQNLIALNCISIEHLQAESVRDNRRLMCQARGRWNAYLVRKYPKKVSLRESTQQLILSSVFLGIRYIAFESLALIPRYRKLLARENFLYPFVDSMSQLQAYLRELINPILVSKESD